LFLDAGRREVSRLRKLTGGERRVQRARRDAVRAEFNTAMRDEKDSDRETRDERRKDDGVGAHAASFGAAWDDSMLAGAEDTARLGHDLR